MKPRKKKPRDLVELFQSTCGWCGKTIPANVEVFGGGGKARPEFDLSPHAGHVIAVHLIGHDKIVLIAVTGEGSDARRDGEDFMYMTCSRACAEELRSALQGEMEWANRFGLG